MEKFISCDWGTSSFRLRLIDTTTKAVLAETISTQGIATTYTVWKEQNNNDRIVFYTNVIQQHIILLELQCGYSLDDLTIAVSGMASASIGLMEVPYKFIPLNSREPDFETAIIYPTENFPHKIIIVSGLRSANDVMRGEETILAGCKLEDTDSTQLLIFPGTHSKHLTIEKGLVTEIKTFMTGEVFELLCRNSILTASVANDDNPQWNDSAFLMGVKESIHSAMLNNIFHVRTNQLFNVLNAKENFWYLSGLLIGEELKSVVAGNNKSVTIVSDAKLLSLYTGALSALGFKGHISSQNATEALINGQAYILRHYQ
jgi:2-dehydro-3-deoxygalactonokinase